MVERVFPGVWRSSPLVLLIGVIVVCIYVNVGVDAKQTALAAVEVVPSVDWIEEEPEHPILNPPAAERSGYVPGDMMSDLREGLEYGEHSDLLKTTRYDAHQLVERWSQELESQNNAGLTVFWLGTDADGVRTGKLAINGLKPTGLIKMQKIDSRWMVVGAEELPQE